MAVREIRLFGDPVLRTPCDPISQVNDSIKLLIQDLEQTTALPGRAGVAANQIGVCLRVFSYQVDGIVGHLINPEITKEIGEPVLMDEGCLSLPELWSRTPRFEKVVVKGQTLSEGEVEISAEGLLAQVFQHEIDHLNGKVYPDRLDADARKSLMKQLRATNWFMAS